MRNFLTPFLFAFLLPQQSQANDNQPIVVTAERFQRSYDESISSIIKIDEEEISESGSTNVADLLKQQAGLNLFTNGAFGKASSLFLRGTSNRHTLILIDGVRVTDITAIGGGARLEFLNTSDIESIEILKGSQGVLYGAEAIGGVINITTKQGLKHNARALVGSFGQQGLSGNTGYKKDDFVVQFNFSGERSTGISTFNEKKTTNPDNAEKDGHETSTLKFKVSNKFGDHKVGATFRYQDSSSDFDSSSSDVIGNETKYQTNLAGANWAYSINKLFNLETKAEFRTVKSNSIVGTSNFEYEGTDQRVELSNKSFIGNHLEFISGISIEKEVAKALGSQLSQDIGRERISLYSQGRFEKDNFFIEFGGRGEKIQFVETKGLYRVALGKRVGNWTFKAHQATGFRVPSLYQSFSSFGNRDLQVEESNSQELGAFYQKGIFSGEVSLFRIRYSNFIDYDSATNGYLNLGAQENRGVEVNGQVTFEKFQAGLEANILRAYNPVTGAYALRRPRQRYSFNLRYQVLPKYFLGVNGQYVGARNDTSQFRLPSYLTFDTSLGYNSDVDKIMLQVRNLFDREYEEIKNFGTPDRNFLLTWERSFF